MGSQRGNILFLILLAVILFAALSYAVTQSLRGGGKDATSENYEAAAADIMSFASLLDSTVSRMLITGGFRSNQISFQYSAKQFDNNINYTASANGTCASSACKVFDANGGGVTPRYFEKYAVTSIVGVTPAANSIGPGYYTLVLFAWPYAGTSANDVALSIAYIKPEICDVIARRTDSITSWTRAGSFIDAATVSNWDNSGAYAPSDNVNMFLGKRLIAYRNPSYNFCVVYQLLIER